MAPAPPAADRPPTRADILRGEYGRYRANNRLLSYHLDVRIDPVAKTIAGKNTISFRMLSEYSREINTVWVDFPETLERGRVAEKK